MPNYKVPMKDVLFLFNDVFDMQTLYQQVEGGDRQSTAVGERRQSVF